MHSEAIGIIGRSLSSSLFSSLENVLSDNHFADVTLVTEDNTAHKAHRIVLSSHSPLLKSLLQENSDPHPILFLSDIMKEEISSILEFMYSGQTKIVQSHVENFMEASKQLKIHLNYEMKEDVNKVDKEKILDNLENGNGLEKVVKDECEVLKNDLTSWG